jgi:UDP-glucose 4-epimerase
MRFKRVAITGGSGRLGRYVAREIAATRAVTVLDRVPTPDGHQFIQADIMDLPRLERALSGHDAVIHLAGIDMDFDIAEDATVRVNTLGTWHVLQAAEKLGIRRVVLCSSSCASGVNEARPDFPPACLPVDEAHPNRPNTGYGVSKLIVETMGDAFARRGMEVLCLRPTLVMFEDIVPGVIARADDPDLRTMFYYVTPEDTAQAFRLALDAEKPAHGAYFITADDSCHPGATRDWLRDRYGWTPPSTDETRYRDNPRASVFSNRRVRDLLGFTPMSNWLEVVAQHRARTGSR